MQCYSVELKGRKASRLEGPHAQLTHFFEILQSVITKYSIKLSNVCNKSEKNV
jgi:hypothetical protein